MPSGPRRPRPRRRRAAHDRSSAADALAQAWAWELAAAGIYQLTRPELELALRRPAGQLIDILNGDPYRPTDARAVGAYLITVHATGPEALRRSYLLLAERLPAHTALPALPDAAPPHRLHHLLAELLAGWLEAVTIQTLAAQETLRTAVDSARSGQEPDNPWFDGGDP